MKKSIIAIVLLQVSLLAHSFAFATEPIAKPILVTAGKETTEGDRFNAIVTEYTQDLKKMDPFEAAYFNIEEDLDKFGDYPSPEYYARYKKTVRTAFEQLKSIHPEKLNETDHLAYRLFKGDMDTAVQQFEYPQELLEFSQVSNRLQSYIDQATPGLSSYPFDSLSHYEKFVKRSEGFAAYVDRQIELLRRGISEKIMQNCEVVAKAQNSYHAGLETDPEKNPFWKPLTKLPASISKADSERLKIEFRKMIAERIVPGIVKFDAFFRQEYAPNCRKGFGIGGLPNGKSWYQYQVLSNTDTSMKPDEIYEIGLQEVKRIEAELSDVQMQLGYKGSLRDFRKSLLTDDRYFFKNSDEVLAALTAVKTQVAEKLPNYFSLRPKSDFSIVASNNPEAPAGMYEPPNEMSPVGRFVFNAQQVRMIPRYEVTTLLMHETAPGHHLQLALQYEMKDKLSEYQRKLFSSDAFSEGWALYSEYLGREMGLYKDPVQRLGNLNDELLRAVRLVVDTGIHSKGWSHDKTVAYMRDHLINDESEIEVEANRYSVWPGQALGYKIGQLKILGLRHLAEKELGPRFDIREFHKVIIGHGTLSLSVMEDEVREWIKSFNSTRT